MRKAYRYNIERRTKEKISFAQLTLELAAMLVSIAALEVNYEQIEDLEIAQRIMHLQELLGDVRSGLYSMHDACYPVEED